MKGRGTLYGVLTYVALVRGVNNIGASTRVSMADLRALFEDIGFRNVRTLLNSGTVVFTARDRRAAGCERIERALAAKLGLTAAVTVLSANDVVLAVRDNPFSRVARDPSRLLVMVPRARPDWRTLKPLLGKRWFPEKLALGRRVAYIWCANGVPRSTLWAAVDRALHGSGTVRNFATMTKLVRLLGAAASPPR